MNALAHTTRIAVTVVIQDDTGRLAALIMALTALIGLLVRFGKLVSDLILLVYDAIEAVIFTAKVFTIGFKAMAYGLGVCV